MKVLIDGQTLLTPDINRGIGTYFKNVVERILELDFVNDYYINTAEDNQLDHLSRWARNRAITLRNAAYHPENMANRSERYGEEAYTDTLNSDLVKHDIDLYWTPNPLMSNVFLPGKRTDCRFASTIYDLIVVIMKDVYLNQWPSAQQAVYMEKLRKLETDYDLFIHISRHTQSDFKSHLNVNDKRHVVTHLAASDFFQPDPFPVTATEHSYVIYIGGFDPRKNMERAVEAFAHLQRSRPDDERIRRTFLYIVCNLDEPSRSKLLTHARLCGVEENVKLTGFVDEHALRTLYQKARCLFFPSQYEGFGLPILEAFACGLPVACSNSSSLPEVGGDLAFYFDADSVSDMAGVLFQALNEPMDFNSRLRRHEYSKQFSWQKTAAATLQGLLHSANRAVASPASMTFANS
jgi:glycosyltransferase involved in cell wall biosynthesis